jgi:hypothetical protein
VIFASQKLYRTPVSVAGEYFYILSDVPNTSSDLISGIFFPFSATIKEISFADLKFGEKNNALSYFIRSINTVRVILRIGGVTKDSQDYGDDEHTKPFSVSVNAGEVLRFDLFFLGDAGALPTDHFFARVKYEKS